MSPSRIDRHQTWDQTGNLIGDVEVEVEVDITAADQNERTIRQLLAVALETNRTYIALASPTAAQTASEIKAIARQLNWLIRTVLGQLDETT